MKKGREMKKLSQLISAALLSGIILLTASCGSDDDSSSNKADEWVSYSGNTDAAIIDANNAELLTVGANSTLEDAFSQQSNILSLMGELSNIDANTVKKCNEGTYSMVQEGASSANITFTDYCIILGTDEVIFNGVTNFSNSNNTQIVKMRNFSVTINGDIINLDATFTISNSAITLDFMGLDGLVYRIENLIVQNTQNGSISVSGRFYHPDHGYVDIYTSSPLVTSDCDGIPRPTQGGIVVQGANDDEASVEYQSCTDYMVCFNNFCNTLKW